MRRISLLLACSLLLLAGCGNKQDNVPAKSSLSEKTMMDKHIASSEVEKITTEETTELETMVDMPVEGQEETVENASAEKKQPETVEAIANSETEAIETEEIVEEIEIEIETEDAEDAIDNDVDDAIVTNESEWYMISEDGTQLTMNLKYTAGTPYVWTHRVDNSNVISIIDDSYNLDCVSDDPMTQRVGGENTYIATFEAKEAGTAVIEMIYTRCDDNGEPTDIVKSCFIKISVNDDLKILVTQSGQEENGIGTVSDWKY